MSFYQMHRGWLDSEMSADAAIVYGNAAIKYFAEFASD